MVFVGQKAYYCNAYVFNLIVNFLNEVNCHTKIEQIQIKRNTQYRTIIPNLSNQLKLICFLNRAYRTKLQQLENHKRAENFRNSVLDHINLRERRRCISKTISWSPKYQRFRRNPFPPLENEGEYIWILLGNKIVPTFDERIVLTNFKKSVLQS